MTSNKRSAAQALLAEDPDVVAVSPRILHAGVTPGPNVMRRGPSIAPASASSIIAQASSPTRTLPTAPPSPSPSPSLASPPGTPLVASPAPVPALSPGFASLMKASTTVSSPVSAGAPKAAKKNVKGKRVTESHVVVLFGDIDGERRALGTAFWNLYDRYRFFKGEVDAMGEMFCSSDALSFMYPNKKRALLEAAGFAWPGPAYLPVNTPVWKFIITPESVEAVVTQSDLILQMRDQIVRLIDGSADLSNGANCEFSVTVTEVDLAESEWPMLFCLR